MQSSNIASKPKSDQILEKNSLPLMKKGKDSAKVELKKNKNPKDHS